MCWDGMRDGGMGGGHGVRKVTCFGVERSGIGNAHSFIWLNVGGDGLSASERRTHSFAYLNGRNDQFVYF